MSRCLFLRCLQHIPFERTARIAITKSHPPLVFTYLGKRYVSESRYCIVHSQLCHRNTWKNAPDPPAYHLAAGANESSKRHASSPFKSFYRFSHDDSHSSVDVPQSSSVKHDASLEWLLRHAAPAYMKRTSDSLQEVSSRTDSEVSLAHQDTTRVLTILPLDKDFEQRYLMLIRLQHNYPNDRTMRRRFFGFKNYLQRRHVKDLSGEEFRAWIHDRPRRHAHLVLMNMLLDSLLVSAQQTLFVLSNVGPFRDNFRNRLRCLRYIFWAYREELTSNEALLAEFDRQVSEVRDSREWPKAPISAGQVRFVLQRTIKEQREAFFQRYLATYGDSGVEAMTEFARSYLRSGDVANAAEVMAKMPEDVLQRPDKLTSTICEDILWRDTIIHTASGPDFKYLPSLLERGFRPSSFLHSRIIEIALAAGYPKVAWDMYRFLSSTNVAIHPWTFSLMLRQAFLDQDIPHLNEMMTLVHSKEELYTDRYILAYSMNMVRVISYYERGCSTDEALAHILALYDRAYNRSSLIKLRVVSDESRAELSTPLPDPPPIMLGYTIWSYILCHRRASYLQRLWNWIQHLAEQGDEKILKALEHDVIYNGFILFHTRRPETLMQALNMVQFMLEKRYCLPTARTWSILVCGFLKHGQLEQARQIVGMMEKHGFSYVDVGEAHLPTGFKLHDLQGRESQILDELALPEGLTLGTSSVPLSLAKPGSDDDGAKSDKSIWDGVVDLRPQGGAETVDISSAH